MRRISISPVPGACASGTGAPKHTKPWLRLVAGGAIIALAVLAAPAAAGAASLAITVPATANLGSVPSGTATRSAQLGTVTVTDDRLLGLSWTATVSTTVFTTGSATAAETIGKTSISYWSGPVTTSSGTAVRTPGQLTSLMAQNLSTNRTAFTAAGVSLVANSTSWNPTIVITIPSGAVAGPYTATITHSVA